MRPWRAVGSTLLLAAVLTTSPRGVHALPVHARIAPTAALPSVAVAGDQDRAETVEMIDVLASALALLLGVFALAMVTKSAGSALSPTPAGASPDRGRHGEARVMATRGLRPHDNARRTRLAREAVSILIGPKVGWTPTPDIVDVMLSGVGNQRGGER